MGFSLALVAIGGAIYLMAIDRFGAGAAVFGTTVASLVGLFLYGRRRQRQELEDKAGSFGPRDLVPPR